MAVAMPAAVAAAAAAAAVAATMKHIGGDNDGSGWPLGPYNMSCDALNLRSLTRVSGYHAIERNIELGYRWAALLAGRRHLTIAGDGRGRGSGGMYIVNLDSDLLIVPTAIVPVPAPTPVHALTCCSHECTYAVHTVLIVQTLNVCIDCVY